MTIDKFGRHLNVVGSTHQTIVDKFGRHLRGSTEEIHSSFLPHTLEGNYDVGGKRLCNIKDPKDKQDCATKNYVTKQVEIVGGRDKQDCATKNYVTKQVEIVGGRGNVLLVLLENKTNARLQSLETKINDSERRLKLKLDFLENGLNNRPKLMTVKDG
ncbi:hypothetical protein QE152_g14163 [Popillia japonica]|uniref:Uncharacterized protein n=1 Tax=Popillia japonica TaxID=7064 RepID=A0AAW1L7F8_POPJA